MLDIAILPTEQMLLRVILTIYLQSANMRGSMVICVVRVICNLMCQESIAPEKNPDLLFFDFYSISMSFIIYDIS